MPDGGSLLAHCFQQKAVGPSRTEWKGDHGVVDEGRCGRVKSAECRVKSAE